MIIINGPTGSGKTTTLNKLKELGYLIIPTYTTRPKRSTDNEDTICISTPEFFERLAKGEFLSTFTAHVNDETWYYGILLCSVLDAHKYAGTKSVVISNYSFTPALNQILTYLSGLELEGTGAIDYPFNVFIDVDYETISENIRGDKITDGDTIKRLRRDDWKMKELRDQSDLVIFNHKFKLSPETIVEMIEAGEKNKRIVGGFNNETNAGNNIRQS